MTHTIPRDLGDGLVLRHSTPEDAQALAKFNREIHGEDEWDARGLEDWTLDLISGEGPTFGAGDFTIVEDTRGGEIISSCCLISQTWAYEGIPIKVGRPELVGTLQDYRRRGLVREQMDVLHQWSAARGELLQVITGIPYYYRQFGYEMAINLGGGRSGFKSNLPKLQDSETEPYTFRNATREDIPFLMNAYSRGCQRSLVSAVWDEGLWQYEIAGKRAYNINRRDIYIIEGQDGRPAGFIGIPPVKWGDISVLTVYELAPGFSWSAVTPSVIRFLWETGERLAEEQNQPQEKFGLWLGAAHPAYDVYGSRLPEVRTPYAYYVRVPDLAALIREISPALENRLVDSAFAHYSGEVKLNFYRDGLKLGFENGRLEVVEKLGQYSLENATAVFPGRVFLQLLFGYRSMDELDHAFADCYPKNADSQQLLNALFPKKPSEVWPVS